MKFTHTLSLLTIAAAAPLGAQSYGSSRPQTSSTPNEAPSGQATSSKPAKELPKPSNKAGAQIVAYAKAVEAKDAAAMAATLPLAKAAAANDSDRYIIAMIQMNAAIAANDVAAMGVAAEEIAKSNYLKTPEVVELYRSLGGTYTQANQFALASSAYERAATLAPNNSMILTNLAESRFAENKIPEGVVALRKAMAAMQAAGTKPGENYYKKALGMAYKANMPVAVDVGREWIVAYPGPDSWHNTLAVYRNLNKPDVGSTMEILRLMAATNSLWADDYTIYGEAAFELGNYVEAQTVLDAGIAAGVVKTTNPEVADLLGALKAKPRTTLADLAAAEKAVTDAKGRLRVGDRYLGLGEYAKAVGLYRAADGQTGVDPNVVKMHLGIALARSGDKAGAEAAFAAVTGPLQPIASFWQTYLKQA